MKIVNREEFMQLPAGTVFCKYRPCVFDELLIKRESCKSADDFYYTAITSAIDCESSDEFAEKLDESQFKGSELKMDFYCEARDACFDEDQLFAVWSRDDVSELIKRLSECVK